MYRIDARSFTARHRDARDGRARALIASWSPLQHEAARNAARAGRKSASRIDTQPLQPWDEFKAASPRSNRRSAPRVSATSSACHTEGQDGARATCVRDLPRPYRARSTSRSGTRACAQRGEAAQSHTHSPNADRGQGDSRESREPRAQPCAMRGRAAKPRRLGETRLRSPRCVRRSTAARDARWLPPATLRRPMPRC